MFVIDSNDITGYTPTPVGTTITGTRIDFAIDDARQSSVMGALFAIQMRSFGDTHPEPAIRGWLEAAGLRNVRRTDLGTDRWLIVGHKST